MDVLKLAGEIAEGRRITEIEAEELWQAECLELLRGADLLRKRFRGDRVHLCSIINAKSGSCSENCRFCAQSGHYRGNAETYPLVTAIRMREAADEAARRGSCCFSIVTSGRRLSSSEIDTICSFAASSRTRGARLSASLGELDAAALGKLKAAGITRFHHNLETAESFFGNICTTHSYGDRLATLKAAKEAGLELCCGGILGLGESRAQRVELAFALRGLHVDSVPLNFLNPMPGTPLENLQRLEPREILRSIAVFRFILPGTSISVCGGREVNLRDLQSWIFFAGANGMMTGGYLTTGGRSVEQDLAMLKDLGLEPETYGGDK